MQEPKGDKDEELCSKVHAFINGDEGADDPSTGNSESPRGQGFAISTPPRELAVGVASATAVGVASPIACHVSDHGAFLCKLSLSRSWADGPGADPGHAHTGEGTQVKFGGPSARRMPRFSRSLASAGTLRPRYPGERQREAVRHPPTLRLQKRKQVRCRITPPPYAPSLVSVIARGARSITNGVGLGVWGRGRGWLGMWSGRKRSMF